MDKQLSSLVSNIALELKMIIDATFDSYFEIRENERDYSDSIVSNLQAEAEKKASKEGRRECLSKLELQLKQFSENEINKFETTIIDDKYLNMCRENKGNAVMNLCHAKFLLQNEIVKKLPKIFKEDFYNPSYTIKYNIPCPRCGNDIILPRLERRVHYNRNIPHIICGTCKYDNQYRHSFYYSGRQIKGKIQTLLKKIELMAGEIDFKFTNDPWTAEDQFVEYEKVKTRLKPTSNKFISECKKYIEMNPGCDLPIERLAELSNAKIEDLEFYNVIRKQIVSPDCAQLCDSIINSIHLAVRPERGNYLSNSINIIEPELEDEIYYNVVLIEILQSRFKNVFYKYLLNQNVLANSIKSNPEYNKTEIYFKNIFLSPLEKQEFFNLLSKLPRNIYLLPNYPAGRVIDFADKDIIQKFAGHELLYLKNCYFDYVAFDDSGFAVKIFEGQFGHHHVKKEYEKKDYLKRKLCDFIGLPFEEIF